MFLRRKKPKREERLEQKYLFLKEIVYLLTRAFYTSQLAWFELIIIVVCGVLGGIGVGIVIMSLTYKGPQTIIIPLNETHIIRVKP